MPVEGTPNCSAFKNDRAVLQTFPFRVAINRVYPHPTESFAKTDDKGRIVKIDLINAKNIPLTLFCLSALKYLSIQRSTFHNHHQRLPAAMELLASSLTELRISDTPIIALPDQIAKMKRLQTIIMQRTGLIHVPESIGAMPSLNILSLTHNDIVSLPTSLRQMTSLTHLTLTNNSRLTSLQPINGHPALTVLIATNCSIKQIPRNLPKLKSLHLSNNDLTSLEGIETLGDASDKSVDLFFDSNRIETIPPTILLVKNLAVLHLNNNTLFYLPEELMRLPSLTELQLKDNARISWEVVELKNRMEIIRPKVRIVY